MYVKRKSNLAIFYYVYSDFFRKPYVNKLSFFFSKSRMLYMYKKCSFTYIPNCDLKIKKACITRILFKTNHMGSHVSLINFK